MPNSAAAFAGRQVPMLPQELCKETVAELNDYFVTDANPEMGGHIQKLVALELHISGAKEQQRQFWEDHGGRTTVRNTFRKKWQAAQNSLKLAFQGDFACC